MMMKIMCNAEAFFGISCPRQKKLYPNPPFDTVACMSIVTDTLFCVRAPGTFPPHSSTLFCAHVNFTSLYRHECDVLKSP